MRELKQIQEPTKPFNSIHEENVNQLYAIDINPFPAQIAAMNLAMRNVNHPVSEMKILRENFFDISPNQTVITPYAIKTAQGEEHRAIKIPKVDAVVANPPYTRWTELSDDARNAIKRVIGTELSKYKMMAGSTQSEPMIYLHFVIHSGQFIENGSRMAMIISNSWLQADYGVRFGKYLLNNFRIIGIIDFSPRVFAVPLIATLVILLERDDDTAQRKGSKPTFLFVDKAEGLATEKILEIVEKPDEYRGSLFVNSIKQQALESGAKWLNILFGSDAILSQIRNAEHMLPADQVFTVTTSNTGWAYWALKHGNRTNIGSKQFFYLTEDEIQTKELRGYAQRAICSARYVKSYSFGDEDWRVLRDKDSPTHFFMCHKPRSETPSAVQRYIHWGETDCHTGIRKSRRGGVVCSQAYTCKERQKAKQKFRGWYDLGGFKTTPIMCVDQSRYRTRFFWCKGNFVAYHAIVCFLPNVELTEIELKAELAFLNSSFSHLYVESEGRAVSVGPIALEVAQAERMPVLDVKSLENSDVRRLASLFDELDSTARELGGADTRANLQKLGRKFEDIDTVVSQILHLQNDLAEKARTLATRLIDRRLLGATEAMSLKGQEQELEMRPPKKKVRVKKEETLPTVSLDEWTQRNPKTKTKN